MLNITQGNPVPLGIQLRRNGADFAPESKGLHVRLTDYYGSREVEDVTVADGRILATVPATVRVGKYGIEITGTQAGSPWRTKYNDVLNITDETVEDVSDERDKATLFIGSYLGGGADIEVPGRGELNIRYGTLEVPAGIAEIGDNAFRLRDNVINIDLRGVEIISNYAFRESTIQSVRGENVTLLRESCFRDCTNLVDVYLPNANATPSFGAFFYGCKALTTISLPSLITCAASMFYNCTNLKNVHLPNLTNIGNATFQNCGELEEIVLPSLLNISPNTFLNCTKLKKVDFTNLTGITTTINYSNIEVIILRRSIFAALTSTAYINNTCTVYVPDELVEEYKAANNWKNHAGQIKGLSEYVE